MRTFKDPTPPNHDRKGLELNRELIALVSLGLTGIASVMGTVEANSSSDKGPQPNIPIVSTTYGNGSVGMQDVMPGDGTIRLPGARVDVRGAEINKPSPKQVDLPSTTTEHQVSQTVHNQQMEWARQLEKDPATQRVLGPEAGVKATLDEVRQALRNGGTVDHIYVHGYASDEDEMTLNPVNDNPGFGHRSTRNEEVAKKRAAAIAQKLKEQIEKEFGSQVASKIEVTGGTEVNDPAEAAAITALARQKNLTPRELVFRYNTNAINLTPQERAVLDGLKQDRYVSMTVVVSRDVVHVTPGEAPESVPEQRGGGISIVFVPIAIPIVRRRRKDVTVISQSDLVAQFATPRNSPDDDPKDPPKTPETDPDGDPKPEKKIGATVLALASSTPLSKAAVTGFTPVPRPETITLPADALSGFSYEGGDEREPLPDTKGPVQSIVPASPRTIGREAPAHTTTAHHHKQPTWLNNGSSQRVNRRGRQ